MKKVDNKVLRMERKTTYKKLRKKWYQQTLKEKIFPQWCFEKILNGQEQQGYKKRSGHEQGIRIYLNTE